jgi:hypothetical protein
MKNDKFSKLDLSELSENELVLIYGGGFFTRLCERVMCFFEQIARSFMVVI